MMMTARCSSRLRRRRQRSKYASATRILGANRRRSRLLSAPARLIQMYQHKQHQIHIIACQLKQF